MEQMEQADHDNLITLMSQMKSIKEGQDNFHKETREAFADLKNNYKARLDDYENRIITLEATKQDFRAKLENMRIEINEKARNNNRYTLLLTGIGILLIGLMLWHIVGYHI
jgi:uncharacterized protein YeeX (DUF496 family)